MCPLTCTAGGARFDWGWGRCPVGAQGEDSNPTSVRCELSSETNLFFYYYHELDEAGFRHLQEGQKLMVDFSEYAAVLLRMLNHCIKEPHSHLAVFVMQRDGSARLDFIQVEPSSRRRAGS